MMTSKGSKHEHEHGVIVTVDDSPARVVIVDDHKLFANLLQRSLDDSSVQVAAVFSGSEPDLRETIVSLEPDVVLLDLHLGSEPPTSIPLIPDLAATRANVVIITASDDRLEHAACLEAGAAGVISKAESLDTLRTAMADALAGRPLISTVDRMSLMIELRLDREQQEAGLRPFSRLTRREAEVLECLCDGRSAAEIAEISFVSLATVRSQVRSILTKLGVPSQLAAVGLARRTGWMRTR